MKRYQKYFTWKVAVLMVIASSGLLLEETANALPSSWFDACILRPTKYPAGNYSIKEVDGISYDDIFFDSPNGEKLHGWYFQKPGAGKTVLLSHGIGGNLSSRVDLIHLFLEANTSVFIYDYEGYGRSSGKASLKNVINDGEAAYEYLTNGLRIPSSRIVLVGESLGTGV